MSFLFFFFVFFFFQAEDGIRDRSPSRGLGDVYKRQKLALVYINTPYEAFVCTSEIEKRISDFLFKAGEPERKEVVYNDYSVEKGLINYGRNGKFDILALPTHGRQRFSHLLLGSIGEDVSNHAAIPVLTFKL